MDTMLEKTDDLQASNNDINLTQYPIVKVQEVEYCKLKVHYEADPEIVKSKLVDAIASLRQVRIPGFRKGKAPDYAIKLRLRPQINQFIAREMVTQAMDDLVFETDIKPIGNPNFSNVTVKENCFTCDIDVVKKPEFEVGNYIFEVKKPKVEVNVDELAEKSLLNLRLRVGETSPYDENDCVELNDQVTFSFNATIEIDGKQEPFEGSVVEGELYTIGSNRWKNFDDNLIGMKAGETKEFDFTFQNGPADLIGESAHFTVTIHMGMKRKPHPINEDFYKVMGVENIEDLLNKLKKISLDSIDRNEKANIRQQVALKLIENTTFEVPKFLIEGEAKHIAAQNGVEYHLFDMQTEDEKEHWMKQGENNIRLSFIIDTIREQEPDAVLNDSEAQNQLARSIASQGQDPVAFFNNPAARSQIISLISSIKDEFALQWIASKAIIVE